MKNRLVRDKHSSTIQANNTDEAIDIVGKEILFLIDDFKEKANSMDSAVVILSDLQEVLNVLDILLDRSLSKKRLELTKEYGGYDKLKIHPESEK